VGKLVDAGYRVARVEQTETPDALKERKKRISGKNKPQVVAREVCGVLTRGTR
jgi:DNA mismatch repair protein MSH6